MFNTNLVFLSLLNTCLRAVSNIYYKNSKRIFAWMVFRSYINLIIDTNFHRVTLSIFEWLTLDFSLYTVWDPDIKWQNGEENIGTEPGGGGAFL